MAIFFAELGQGHIRAMGAGRVFAAWAPAQFVDLRSQIFTQLQWIAHQIVSALAMRHA